MLAACAMPRQATGGTVHGVTLDTPWLRDDLREHLSRLAAARPEAESPELEAFLDFLDETGVAEDPGSAIGYILRDEREASVIATLGLRLDHTLDDPTDDGWDSVSDAARSALAVLDA
jgi:hypothetical protein